MVPLILVAGAAAAAVLVRHFIDRRARKLVEEALRAPVPAIVPLMGRWPATRRARRF